MPPVSLQGHATPHFHLITWLGLYRIGTPGLEGGDTGSIRLDMDNMPQPDAFLLVLPSFGGQARISADDYVEGGPELVAEVASSSVSYDLYSKLNAYRRNAVREYIVWRTRDRAVDWFVLRGGTYEPLLPGQDGIVRSEVFPGLWLDPRALILGDMPTVAIKAHEGLASPEHATFLDRLKAATPPPEA